MKHQTLHELLSIQAGSKNNLFSYDAKTYKGSLLGVDKKMKEYQKAGLIQQIPFDIKPRERRKQYFYFVTRKGAMAIDRLENYKQNVPIFEIMVRLGHSQLKTTQSYLQMLAD
jgi:integrase